MTEPKNTEYKIVFCDIDGTLIDSDTKISDSTAEKIRELDSIGVPFVLVSARMPSGIMPILNELGISAPIVCYSGALILGESGECVKSIGIDGVKAVQIDTYFKEEWKDICCGAFYNDNWIVDDTSNEWVMNEQDITSSIATKGSVAGCIEPNGHVHKFLCMGEASRIAKMSEAIKAKFPGLSVCLSKDTYLEIMDGAVSKSGAVVHLCESYGISAEEAVSFGDNYNDSDMLRATGFSFAMGNAPEEVKRQAKSVTKDNDNEGVLAGLNKLSFTGI